MSNQQTALYSQGTFDIATPSAAQQATLTGYAQEVAQSGFGTFYLGQWHVHSDGTLYYNNTAYTPASFDWVLTNVPAVMKAGGVQRVCLTFGPQGSDFDNIRENMETFQAALQEIFNQYPIDGIDFDIEGNYSPENATALASLATWVQSQGKIVTAAPYMAMEWWVSLAQQTSSFAWWNLQLYGGADYPTWVTGLQGAVANPQSFLTCGFNANGSPAGITSTLQQYKQQYPGLAGAFVWKYGEIEGDAAAFASAIAQGLS